MKNALFRLGMSIIAAIAFVYVCTQLWLGFMGISFYANSSIAVIAIILAVPFGFFVPVIIGTILCAINILHWSYIQTVFFTLPSIALIFPQCIGIKTLSGLKGKSLLSFLKAKK